MDPQFGFMKGNMGFVSKLIMIMLSSFLLGIFFLTFTLWIVGSILASSINVVVGCGWYPLVFDSTWFCG